jgi:hypothetical protein
MLILFANKFQGSHIMQIKKPPTIGALCLSSSPASGVGKADARQPAHYRTCARAALDSRQFLFSPGFFILTRATAPHAISEAVNAAD